MPVPVLFDTTVLSNFVLVGRPDLALHACPGEPCTTADALAEYQEGAAVRGLPADSWASLPPIALTEPEIELMTGLPGRLGPGERSCLAVAMARQGVRTDAGPEAIIDQAKRKTLRDYQELVRESFARYYRWLKPGRWMTVEFHNSHNAVWNAIQEALMAAGFVVADVRTLDKQQGSYRQVTAASAAKQDLVISAYKPRTAFEQRFLAAAGSADAAWDFARQHLAQLPVVVEKDGRIEVIAERQAYLLFDRMVAFHIQRGAAVPLSAAEFYAGLRQRFVERDGGSGGMRRTRTGRETWRSCACGGCCGSLRGTRRAKAGSSSSGRRRCARGSRMRGSGGITRLS